MIFEHWTKKETDELVRQGVMRRCKQCRGLAPKNVLCCPGDSLIKE